MVSCHRKQAVLIENVLIGNHTPSSAVCRFANRSTMLFMEPVASGSSVTHPRGRFSRPPRMLRGPGKVW